MPLNNADLANFATLKHAFLNEDVVLTECYDTTVNQYIPVICAVKWVENKDTEKLSYTLVPIAQMLKDPYRNLLPPSPTDITTNEK